jgi:hypothetical protein
MKAGRQRYSKVKHPSKDTVCPDIGNPIAEGWKEKETPRYRNAEMPRACVFVVAAMGIGSAMTRAERGGPVDTKIVKIRAQMGEIWTLKDQPATAALIQRRDEVGGW